MSEQPITLAGEFGLGPVHFIHTTVQWHQEDSSPYLCGALGNQASTARTDVTCLACIRRMGVGAPTPQQDKQRRAWTLQVVAGITEQSFADWLHLHGHSTVRPPRHTPPRMEDESGEVDGVFEFYDGHLGEPYALEVVPQFSGNVEIAITHEGEGVMFTLRHLDRADLIRALLHDFHYSPERGGPNDD